MALNSTKDLESLGELVRKAYDLQKAFRLRSPESTEKTETPPAESTGKPESPPAAEIPPYSPAAV